MTWTWVRSYSDFISSDGSDTWLTNSCSFSFREMPPFICIHTSSPCKSSKVRYSSAAKVNWLRDFLYVFMLLLLAPHCENTDTTMSPTLSKQYSWHTAWNHIILLGYWTTAEQLKTLAFILPPFSGLFWIVGVAEYLSTEICTSRQKRFSLVTFVDSPGLVDGDMKYPFDVDEVILWLGGWPHTALSCGCAVVITSSLKLSGAEFI